MRNVVAYRLSLGLSILFSLAAFVTVLGWIGRLINNIGRLPLLELIPWTTLGLLALAAINCTFRARFIIRRYPQVKSE